MRRVVIALVVALSVISLLAVPVMAQGPDTIHIPAEASQGAGQANGRSDEQAPQLVPDWFR